MRRCVRFLIGRGARRPFVEHGPVESFDFAVDLWLAGWNAYVADPVFGEGVTEQVALVTRAVVGHDGLDRDAVVGEPVGCSLDERHSSSGFLVVEDLDVGQAGVVVDSGMDVSVSEV